MIFSLKGSKGLLAHINPINPRVWTRDFMDSSSKRNFSFIAVVFEKSTKNCYKSIIILSNCYSTWSKAVKTGCAGLYGTNNYVEKIKFIYIYIYVYDQSRVIVASTSHIYVYNCYEYNEKIKFLASLL